MTINGSTVSVAVSHVISKINPDQGSFQIEDFGAVMFWNSRWGHVEVTEPCAEIMSGGPFLSGVRSVSQENYSPDISFTCRPWEMSSSLKCSLTKYRIHSLTAPNAPIFLDRFG